MARKDRRDRKSNSEKVSDEPPTEVRKGKSRQPCCCEATRHALINNCLNCGRIVCQAEGSGPCFTCNNLVCTNEERNAINSKTPSGDAMRKKLMGDDFSLKSVGKMVYAQDYQHAAKAIEHKNKLLEFDRISKQQTKIIDDQSDYHNIDSNVWLTSEQKQRVLKKQEEVHEKRHSRSKPSQLTIDFAGRKLVEEMPEEIISVEALLNDDESIYEHVNICKTDIVSQYRPKYQDSDGRNRIMYMEFDKNDLVRIQDKELQCMSDEGMCLSVHQPYASLLVAGIKKHEGRQWYSSLRGRLWIHAGAFSPRPEDISSAEVMYRELRGDVVFPTTYPTGVLLGCVEVTECLSQEEYVRKYPTGECGTVFVFVCENPQELKVKIPMRGKRRIFKLEPRIHKAAKRTLQMLS